MRMWRSTALCGKQPTPYTCVQPHADSRRALQCSHLRKVFQTRPHPLMYTIRCVGGMNMKLNMLTAGQNTLPAFSSSRNTSSRTGG
jgi:hypothetical protein